MKRIFVFLLFFCAGTNAIAQKYSYNADSLKASIQSIADAKGSELWSVISDDFSAALEDNRIDENIRTKLVEQLNKMDAVGVRTSPHFENYLLTVTNLPLNVKEKWYESADLLITKIQRGKYKELGDFLKFSNEFFNNGILKESAQRIWVIEDISKYKYKISIEDNKPFLNFEKLNLETKSKKDSIIIYETKGSYDIFEEIWNGSGGKIDWKRGNWNESKNKVNQTAFAVLDNYTIQLKKPNFSAPATLNFQGILPSPQKGIISNQLAAPIKGRIDYPKFETEAKDIKLGKIVDGIEFTGGLGLYGDKIQVRGDSLTSALMTIKNDKSQKVLRSKSRLYSLTRDQKINAQDCEISVYFGVDSIYHPNLNVDYNITSKLLRLVRGEKSTSKIAFMDSYHQLELNTDALEWNLNENKIAFRATSQMDKVPVKATSFNYFDPSLVAKYRKEVGKDPFVILANWYESLGEPYISADDFAGQIGGNLSLENIRSVIFDLVKDGFIYYDPITKNITIRNKTSFYRDAFKKEIDFDNIDIVSVAGRKNYEIDLESKDLKMEGVEQMPISNKKRVALFPTEKNLIVNKNREIKAIGDLVAANVDIVKADLSFNYDEFSIKIDSAENLLFYFPDEDGNIKPIKNTLDGAIGKVWVDDPFNKSGLSKTENYPKLEVSNQTKIIFDIQDIRGGAYEHGYFYFMAEPFKIDDLSQLTVEDLTFNGFMNFGDIFPNVKQTARIKKNLYIGFDESVVENDLPTYNNKASFSGNIKLTENGLIPEGSLSYLSTEIKGSELLYLPDVMKGLASSFDMKETTIAGTQFPDMKIQDVLLEWKPSADSMSIVKKEGLITCFKDLMKVDGEMLLQSEGLSSVGKVEDDIMKLESELFNYSSKEISSDSTKVMLYDITNNELVLRADSCAVTYSPYEQNGELSLRENGIAKLQQHAYWLNADDISWDGNSRKLAFKNKAKDKGYMVSKVPSEDSLNIEYELATLTLDDNVLKISGANEIKIADAIISPKDGKFTLTPETRIDSLKTATIQLGEKHTISNSSVQIISKNSYEGYGDYDYSVKGLPLQTIHLDMIKTKEDVEQGKKGKRIRKGFYTLSNANILPEDNFRLDPLMKYKGAVYLDAREEFLTFEGFGKIDVKSNIETQWFAFNEKIDPEKISINLQAPVGEYKDSLQIGLAYSASDFKLYPAFLSSYTSSKDFAVFDARGNYTYNADNEQYIIGDSARFDADNYVGDLLEFSDKEQRLSGDGKFQFYNDLGMVKADIAGTFEHTIKDSTTTFNDLIIGLKFKLEEDVFEKIQKNLDDWASENKEIDFMKSEFHKAIPHIFSEEKARTVLEKYEGDESFERPENFEYELFFANVDMVWDTLNRSFRSVGDFGLSYVGSKPINSQCSGYIEFAPRSTGDQINIYLEMPDPDTGGRAWMFFSYKKGIMEINSSKSDFNQDIENVKSSKAMFTDKSSGLSYQFTLGSMNKKNNFVVRMRDSAPPEE